MAKQPSKTKYKGQAARTALALFGVSGRRLMEQPEAREALALVLRMSSKPAIRMLAQEALDPLFAGTSFARLAENNGLNVHMISDEYTAIMRSEGFIRAAQHIPDLMEGAALDAMSRDETCPACNGAKVVPKLIDKGKETARTIQVSCETCEGKGERHVLGNADRLKLIFETFGLTGKAGGVNVNLDLRKPPDSHESMEQLSQSIAPLLEGTQVVKP